MNRRRFLARTATGLAAILGGAAAATATADPELPQPTNEDGEYVREPTRPGLNAGGPAEPDDEEDYTEHPNHPGPNAGGQA